MSISLFEILQEKKEFPSSGATVRTDSATENAIEHGISLQRTIGTTCAIEYLLAHGVPRQITQRVLTQPERRRSQA